MSKKFDLNKDYLPKGKELWLVFDLANGHPYSHRYCWWFDSRKAAREHIKWQKSVYGAGLSSPIKFVRS